MLRSQDGKCAICREPERRSAGKSGETRKLSIDHDHVTGKVRGLLCSDCNTAIALLRESPPLLDAARAYLMQHQYARASRGDTLKDAMVIGATVGAFVAGSIAGEDAPPPKPQLSAR